MLASRAAGLFCASRQTARAATTTGASAGISAAMLLSPLVAPFAPPPHADAHTAATSESPRIAAAVRIDAPVLIRTLARRGRLTRGGPAGPNALCEFGATRPAHGRGR